MEQRNEPTTAEIVNALEHVSQNPHITKLAISRIEQLERENAERGQALFDRDAKILLLEAQVSDERGLREQVELQRDILSGALHDLEFQPIVGATEFTIPPPQNYVISELTARAEKAEAERDAAYERGYENGFNNLLDAQNQ